MATVGAKEKLITWWILFILVLFLWYRNYEFDRIIAIFLFISALIQIFEYSVYSGADPQKEGYKVYLALWFQCLALCLAVYIYLQIHADELSSEIAVSLAGWLTLIFGLIFIVAILYLISHQNIFTGEIANDGIAWYLNDSPLMGHFTWLYLLGIIAPLVLLLVFTGMCNLTLIVLLLYIFAVVIILYSSNRDMFITRWVYLSIGVGFLAWMAGLV